jgi:hypothetical protein
MRRARLGVIAVACISVTAAVACGGDSGTGPGPVDLSGSYALVNLFFQGVPTTATGTLAMTSAAFTANIHVTAPSDTMIVLGGSYVTAKTDSIYLTPPQPYPQIPGTYYRSAAKDTLVLNLSFSGSSLTTTWLKQ